ncbi:MAG: ABC transporter ATP-binding protein, partial [Acidimicrobiales bacterium]
MAWGGTGGYAGSHGGASAPGLPFAGIPPERQAGVDRILASEPEHPEPDVDFTQRPGPAERNRLTLWLLLTRYPARVVLALVLVVIVALGTQAGPKLTQLAIDDGMLPGHHDLGVVAALAGGYLLAVVVTALAQRSQVRVTGRLAAWVMRDLRVRVFTHLQRLSLDFFTEEKAGVIMTRMTSDIENLQQLLQDGLWQFAVQGLTMAVITIVLFTLNVRLAIITVLLVMPILTVMSLWFRRASEHGYGKVRDGIANVLADLSESLHGVRVVTAHNRQAHNVVHHRNVVGDYRRANYFTAEINAVYGPSTQLLGVVSQAALL